jgi:hypothetical protein
MTVRTEIASLIHRDAAANAAHFIYGETRPIPYANYKAERWKVTTDCSGWYGCMCYAAGAPNPFGLSYASGEGFTGDLLGYLKPIQLSQVQPGDCVVYGAYPGVHVAVFADAGRTVGSFGAPGQPHILSLDQETAGFPGRKVTYLQLPVAAPKRTLWVVRNGKGEILVRSTAHPARWAALHSQAFRRYGIVSFHREEQS